LSALILVLPQWSLRPQVFSMLLFMVTVQLALGDRLWWILPVLALWANAHAIVVFGVAVVGLVALEALIWTRRRFRRAALATLAAAAVPTISPLGFDYWPRVVETVRHSRTLGIAEYRSAWSVGWEALGFWILLAVLVVVCARGRRGLAERSSSDRVLLLAAGALALASLLSIRNVAYFALIAVPAVSRLLPASPVRRSRPAQTAGIALVCISVLAGICIAAYRWRDAGSHLGWQPINQAAIGAVRACPPPIYNGFGEGGILMWFVPEQRVFVDGRVEAYPPALLHRVWQADVQAEYRDLFADYGVKCAVVRTESTLERALRQDPTMNRRFTDNQWTVFVQVASASNP
jgi:hypothetical protein